MKKTIITTMLAATILASGAFANPTTTTTTTTKPAVTKPAAPVVAPTPAPVVAADKTAAPTLSKEQTDSINAKCKADHPTSTPTSPDFLACVKTETSKVTMPVNPNEDGEGVTQSPSEAPVAPAAPAVPAKPVAPAKPAGK
jgi:hypothetical protein